VNAWFETVTGLHLLRPWWGGAALLAAAVLAALLVLRNRRRQSLAATFAPGVLVASAPLPRTWRARLIALPVALQALSLGSAFVALGQPVHRVELPAVRTGLDVVLCLDVSSSMAARDAAGTDRLTAARGAAATFVAARADDRIGLIAFARYPDLVCPPTLDHLALERMLGALQHVAADGPEDATGIGTAVARAVQVLTDSPSAERVVILVTDGEENVAAASSPDEIGPLQAAQLAVANGVRVHSLAVGGGEAGAEVDTGQIEELATRTGGRFFRVADAAAMVTVYREIDRLERTPFVEPRFRFEPRHAPFVGLALLLAALATLLRRTWLEVIW